MNDSLKDKQRLQHILEAIKQIETFTENLNFEVFESNLLVRSACIFPLQIIGEAANKISMELKNKYDNTDWINMTGLRNIIAHEYWGIDYSIVWTVISFDLPKLKNHIQNILIEEKL